MDVIPLLQKLLQFPSITPQQEGCLDFIEGYLKNLGFTCTRLPFGEVDNLYARWGKSSPNFCFAGHIDVVPVVDETKWSYSPFAATIHDGILYGRGVVDMKGAIAAFLSAVTDFIQHPFSGSISFLLTSDEEGPAVNGSRQVVKWLQQNNETLDACLVGEPTNPKKVGEMIKIGRRGSLNIDIRVEGKAGHVAYPFLAKNPIPVLLDFLHLLVQEPLDTGTDDFDPSHLEITSIDVENLTRNIIPSVATARANIRFNPLHTKESLQEMLTKKAAFFPLPITIETNQGCEAFLLKDPQLQEVVVKAVEKVCSTSPCISTTGGTSDARFIKDICPVIEFGLVNATAHHIDEHISVEEVYTLANIYKKILETYFNTAP